MAGVMGGARTVVHRGDRRCPVRSRVLHAVCHCRPRPSLWPGHGRGSALRTRRGSGPPGTRHRARHRLLSKLPAASRARCTSSSSKASCRAAPSRAAARPHREAARHATIADNEVNATLESLGMRAGRRRRLARHAAVPSLRHRDRSRISSKSSRASWVSKRSRRPTRRRAEVRPLAEEAPVEAQALEILAARGYQEAITYAFVDPGAAGQHVPRASTLALATHRGDMAVMRASLWPGLIKAALENQRRQQDRIRLFEHGARFEHRRHRTDLLPASPWVRAGRSSGRDASPSISTM